MGAAPMPDGDAAGEDESLSAINTTPLVDVMLVLLIIFLITVPMVTRTVPVTLPKGTTRPAPDEPAVVTIAVDRDGRVFWNGTAVPDAAAFTDLLRGAAQRSPAPPLRIHADTAARYGAVARVVATCRSAGIARIGFVTEPALDRGETVP